MKLKIGVMGSAAEATSPQIAEAAHALGKAIAACDLILLTGATTGLVGSALI
jgi:predicted Rossmann-fold nucleotide-binding protein